MKKHIALAVATIITCLNTFSVFAVQDTRIFTDEVKNTYIGRSEAGDMINNLNFTDIPPNHWAKPAIVQSGALNMIKGYDKIFKPNDAVTNQEGVAFAVRILGLEREAQAAAVQAVNQMPLDSPLRTLWSIGYLNVAMQNGIITPQQYNDSLAADPSTQDPVASFVRTYPTTREQIADWIVKGLTVLKPDSFLTLESVQAMYTFSDWESISVDKVAAVEAVASKRIMLGDDKGRFRPKGNLTRAEMAQILKNIDSIFFEAQGIEKKTGTVGGIKDNQVQSTGTAQLWRSIYIRTADGTVDTLQYQMNNSSSPQAKDKDVVVYRDGNVGGLNTLNEGDVIEYLVSPPIETALFVNVISAQNQKNVEIETKTVQGILVSADTKTGQITIKDANNKQYSYPMIEGLFGTEGTTSFVYINEKKRDVKTMPVGSRLELRLRNNIVDDIKYLGETTVITEQRGIVIENDPDLGFLTYIDRNGNEVTKNYIFDEIRVKKQEYYDNNDEIGYISEVFPNFKYNPRETDMSAIEAGDIVFMRFSPDDPDTIVNVSASTSYTIRYGKIKEFNTEDNVSTMVIEYEDKQTSWFDVVNDIFISKDGKPIAFSDVKVGDWTKILINQAMMGPGYVVESVKEMAIEGDEHFISSIVKGQLAGINAVQKQLIIQNAETLSKKGWTNHKDIQQYSLAGKDIEFYHENKRISLDYATKYLKRSDGEVYVALENNFTGEKVKKVTFRNGRDEILSADTVLNSDGNGGFTIISNDGTIQTDTGTIVRRFGRLVDGNNIMIPDYAVVSLNGENKAAIVDITEGPDASGVLIARARLISLDEGKSFKVQSESILTGNEWTYTPVQREYKIDYNTLFLNADGFVKNEEFIDYTETSAINKVYNIVADGSRASHVIESAYAKYAVRGTIYKVEDGTISIKNTSYYENSSGKWISISDVNSAGVVTVLKNTITVKSNKIVNANTLQAGEQIKIMTGSLPEKPTSGLTVEAVVIQVEK